MNYRSVLVHIDGPVHGSACVRLAGELALLHGAHLVGLGPAGVAQGFTALMHERGLASCEWRELGTEGGAKEADSPLAALLRHAPSSDLLVLGQAEPRAGQRVPDDEFVSQVFLQAGRPVLIVPRRGVASARAQHVLVAWNGTRESNRAIADALPLLRKAAQVFVVCFDRPDEAAVSRLQLNDLQRWFERHEVEATVTQRSTDDSFADALLAQVARRSCDLLVMGGYGHRRLAERVLGGVTREVLARATVPVFVSH
jgi:nucleotide-binding universal stress UspA family protein